tara:strand:+ start:159 stop:539 length:381 start_codon:yes stop_codon:yes gene_type:complete
MAEKGTNKKTYRIVQIEGKMTFKIEELWDGGIERAPFGSKAAAIMKEENIARDNGFIDDLVLQDVVEEKTSPKDAFEKDASGTWHCKEACAIEIGNKEIVFTTGMTFTEGTQFMGIDVAKWLDESH